MKAIPFPLEVSGAFPDLPWVLSSVWNETELSPPFWFLVTRTGR